MIQINAATNEQLDALAAAGTADAVLPQFAAFTRLVATSGLLGRALAEPGATREATSSLLADLTKGKLSEDTISTIVVVTRNSSAKSVLDDLFAAVVELAFKAAVRADAVDSIENGLYAVSAAVADNNELRQAMSNPGVSDLKKQSFLLDLLGDKLDARAFEIVRTLVSIDHGRALDEDARELSKEAAQRRNAVVAEVRTAVELDDTRKQSLTAALQVQAGKAVSARFITDPTVVGSVIVRIGDDVLDGSIRHRFEQARLALQAN